MTEKPQAAAKHAGSSNPSISVTVHLPVVTRAAHMARETVRNALRRCGLDALVDDVLIVTSELVTGAVRRGGDDIFLELHIVDGTVEIAVGTPPPVIPLPRVGDDDENDTTRASTLVTALTSQRGVDLLPDGGSRAWARIPLTTATEAAEA